MGKGIDNLPWRLFVDSSTLQTLHRYGEFVYDGGDIASDDPIWTIPKAFENVEALRKIMFVGQRAQFEFVLSQGSLNEVSDKGDSEYLAWAFEVLNYWNGILSAYAENDSDAMKGSGATDASKLASRSFDYLGDKDRELLQNALTLECEGFLTMDRKLRRNARHIESKLPILILEPSEYWERLRRWAYLFV